MLIAREAIRVHLKQPATPRTSHEVGSAGASASQKLFYEGVMQLRNFKIGKRAAIIFSVLAS
ncbi:MAG TPA: hypothetical protein VN156_03690, partial [Pseudomonas sp.]|nr:hypothetical protein [Pseudomonas sp.]